MSCINILKFFRTFIILKFVCHHQYFIQTQLNEIHLPINFYTFYMQSIAINKLLFSWQFLTANDI